MKTSSLCQNTRHAVLYLPLFSVFFNIAACAFNRSETLLTPQITTKMRFSLVDTDRPLAFTALVSQINRGFESFPIII